MEDITFDILTGQVNVNGKQQRLTKTEARLFWELYRHAGTVIDYDTLITRVWGEGYLGEIKYLQDYIRLLRHKIEPDPANPRYILNVRGYGYQLNLTK